MNALIIEIKKLRVLTQNFWETLSLWIFRKILFFYFIFDMTDLQNTN